jgi:hypothetical protein
MGGLAGHDDELFRLAVGGGAESTTEDAESAEKECGEGMPVHFDVQGSGRKRCHATALCRRSTDLGGGKFKFVGVAIGWRVRSCLLTWSSKIHEAVQVVQVEGFWKASGRFVVALPKWQAVLNFCTCANGGPDGVNF